jgi:hypothetical protein
LFIFHFKFYFLDSFISNGCCCGFGPCAINFGTDCTCHCISSQAV